MKPKLLVLCPSRGRSKRIMDMLDSFDKTTNREHTRLQILLDKDDLQLKEYFRNLPSWARIKVYDRGRDRTLTTEIINRAFLEDNDFQFYSVINDDIEFLTSGWDELFCNKNRISTGIDDSMVRKYGKDSQFIVGIPTEGFPIISGIDGNIARALGWMQYPTLRHSAGDNVWFWIAWKLNILHINKDIHWNHKSAYFNEGESDETFKKSNAYNNIDDYYVYKDWLKYKSDKDLIKILEAIPEIKKHYEQHLSEQRKRFIPRISAKIQL